MIRFYLAPREISGKGATVRGEALHYIRNVLRLKTNAEARIFDGSGNEYLCRIDEITPSRASLSIIELFNRNNEPSAGITLALGISKPKSFEFTLQKTTELGVKRFVPMVTARSLDPAGAVKISRWKRIIRDASRQCGRSVCPELAEAAEFSAVIQTAPGFGLSMIPWEEEEKLLIGEALQRRESTETLVFIGPEGGFSPGEVEAAKGFGVVPVSLGPRILRAETAACAVVSMLVYRFDLTPPAFSGGACGA